MQTNVQQEHSELSELMGDFDLDNAKGKGIAADHAIEQQFVQSEYNMKQVGCLHMFGTLHRCCNRATSKFQKVVCRYSDSDFWPHREVMRPQVWLLITMYV